MTDVIGAFLEASVRAATPLAFAALGESVVEKSGIINIGLEGIIVCGALGAVVASGFGDPVLGILGGMAAGALMAVVFAVFAVGIGANQIITGTAITLFSLGLTGTLYRGVYGPMGSALVVGTMHPWDIPGLSGIPLVGQAFFAQPPVMYLLYVLAPAVWWWMYRTHAGLGLRAVGENPLAATVAGISPQRVRFGAILFGGLMGGIAGAVLVVAQAGTFAEGMSAGRGFIAVAIVVLGRWHPVGALVAALLFGAASALQYFFQAMGWNLPYQLFLAVPYIVTLLALAGAGGRLLPPAALGKQNGQHPA